MPSNETIIFFMEQSFLELKKSGKHFIFVKKKLELLILDKKQGLWD